MILRAAALRHPRPNGERQVRPRPLRSRGKIGGEILAVDSMTVYRGMDLGTAKPTPAERAEVRYHGLDLVRPNESFTVARWLEAAEATIADAAARGVPLILCGGTPLYYQSLFHGLFDGPPADMAFRRSLDPLSGDELRARLATVDAITAERLHANDRRRLVRALEVHRATGRPISEQQTQWSNGPRYKSVRFGLAWDRPTLNRRINLRAKQTVAEGWPEEVRGLLEQYGDFSDTARDAAGYRLLADVARGRLSLDDATEQIKIKTRQLAKRQVTWFRRFEAVTWLPGEAPLDENIAVVRRRLGTDFADCRGLTQIRTTIGICVSPLQSVKSVANLRP